MIRQCTVEDKDLWISMNKSFINYEYQSENVWNNPLNSGDLGEDFDCILQNDSSDTLLFMMMENDQAVGFMNVQTVYSVWSHGKVYLLDDFFIIESYRGKGYGTKALEELELFAKQKGIKQIRLMAENTNPKAVAFYQRRGFSQQEINLFLKKIINK